MGIADLNYLQLNINAQINVNINFLDIVKFDYCACNRNYQKQKIYNIVFSYCFMKKRDMLALIVCIFFFMVGIVSAGNTQSQGVVSLFIENITCGNGICNSGETCSNCPADCGACVTPPSGGGGGGGVSKIKNFTLDKDLIKVTLKQGESRRETLTIRNGEIGSRINLRVDSEDLKKYMIINEESFFLAAGKSKTVNVDFFVGEDEIPETYLGRITVISEDLTKAVNVILEIKEKHALFDILTKVQNAFASPGQKINANIKLINVGDLRGVDVKLYYAIKDFNNSVITFKEETLAINQEIDIVRGLKLPEDIPLGKYVFYSSITYGGNLIASSSDVFDVVTPQELIMRNLMIAFLIVMFLVIVVMLIRLYEARKKERELKVAKT